MLKFNNDHIFTGYLKQLLSSFNLPMCRVYTRDNYRYKEQHGEESPEIIKSIIKDSDKSTTHWNKDMVYIQYIKDDEIQEYVKKTETTNEVNTYWRQVGSYFENRKKLNLTKNLKIKNNIYDTYTHEYLGNYLRFMRDFYNIDLMPLYNCFSNNLCLNLKIDSSSVYGEEAHKKFTFNSSLSGYKIYMIPIKLFKEYTIAIDCNNPIEMCCGIYGDYLADFSSVESFKKLIKNTYTKIGHVKFARPYLFSKLQVDSAWIKSLTDNEKSELALNENNLKLFIKIPENSRSSIAILEGNYLRWNDLQVNVDETNNTNLLVRQNHVVTNFEDFDITGKKALGTFISAAKFSSTRTFKPITNLQLLKLNTGESYPFADKLIEYLIGNAITSNDEIPDNIVRVQTAIAAKTKDRISGKLYTGEQSGVWDERLRAEIYHNIQNLTGIRQKLVYNEETKTSEYKKCTDDTVSKNNRVRIENNHDILGYADKTAEKFYTFDVHDSNPLLKSKIISMGNVDIYPEIYKADKQEE